MSLRIRLQLARGILAVAVAAAALAAEQRPSDVKLVRATLPTTTVQEDLLFNELQAARQAGNTDTAHELQAALDALHGVTGGSPQPPAAWDGFDRVRFPTGEEQSGGERWAGDVRITESDMDRREPSLAAAPDGELFAAVEESSGWIRLYRSANGGQSWAWFVGITSGTAARHPSLIYAESAAAGTWLYVAYLQENADSTKEVRAYRQDPNNMDNWDFTTVASNIADTSAIYPRICSDVALFGAYYLYVTYTANYIDYYPALFSRSTDYGLTWSAAQNLTGGAENSQFPSRPDVAFGTAGLFVAFEKLGWDGSAWVTQVWITRSANYGSSWSTPVQFVESGESFHPSVAAAVDSNALVVGYTRDYGTDTDLHYAYSTDGGATYTAGYSLDWSYDDEDSADLAVSPSGGRFHAAYRHVNEIWYTSAAVATPTSWSSAIVVNDTGTASATYPLPGICTTPPGLPNYEACVAWTDFRNPFYDAYFDHAFAGCVGDMNCDGVIDFGDINPFVTFLSNFAAWQGEFPGCNAANGDINCDGVFGQGSFGDINPFVALMTQCGGGCPCPGPGGCP
jgi:hypothetical protein